MNALVHIWYLWASNTSTFNISIHTNKAIFGNLYIFLGWIGSWLAFLQYVCHWLVGLMKDQSLYQCLVSKECTMAYELNYHQLFLEDRVFYYIVSVYSVVSFSFFICILCHYESCRLFLHDDSWTFTWWLRLSSTCLLSMSFVWWFCLGTSTQWLSVSS